MRIRKSLPQRGGLEPTNIGPVIPFLQDGLIDCARGFTYILPMDSLMGKTMAAEYLVAELLQGRNALYVSASGDKEIVNTLQATLNTTVGSTMLAKCLVAALGTTGVARDYELPSLLIIDEVNRASESNKAFIEDLFLGINRDRGMTCVILTNKEEVAEALLALNRGKIRPFPGSVVEPWKPLERPEWLRNVHWTSAQLQELIRYTFGTQLGGRVDNLFSPQFPADEQTPGDILHVVDLKIQKREIY